MFSRTRSSWPGRRRGRHARSDRPLRSTALDVQGDGARRRSFDVTGHVNPRRVVLDELLAALQCASDLRGVLVWDETSALRVVVSFAGRGGGPAVSVTANFLDGRWWYAWAPDGGGPGGEGGSTTIAPVHGNAVHETLNVCRRALWNLAR